jgi:hypothetical protein
MVWVNPDSVTEHSTERPALTLTEQPDGSSNHVKALEGHVQSLKEQINQLRADHTAERERLLDQLERLRADHEAALNLSHHETDRVRMEADQERHRADEANAHARDLAGQLDQTHRERHGEAERLRHEIDALRTELKKPWWRRLVGW